ncbi:MAG: DUF4280 domain-containing protein [Paludibacteraceae bacterium]|nr:DUF4280 domain-containing protein [Paludibacteraceae bacterium]
MGKFVCNNAKMQCSFGMIPGTFIVVDPMRPKLNSAMAIGNVMDNKPMVNITSFGMCRSLANPSVASATAAALGTLTPMPCVPVIPAPWAPPGQVMIANVPVLLDNCKCMCAWGGQISFVFPGNALPTTTAK